MQYEYIYSLSNPLDGKMFYIGKSKNPKTRVLHHVIESRKMVTNKDKLIDLIYNQGLLPCVEILEAIEVDYSNPVSTYNVFIRENFWINEFSKSENLLNIDRCTGQGKEKTYSQANDDIINLGKLCLKCGLPLFGYEKKRVKSFCDSTCRSGYWQKQKRKKPAVSKIKPIEPPKVAAVNITPEQSKEVLEGAKKASKTKFTVNQPKAGSLASFLKSEGDLK